LFSTHPLDWTLVALYVAVLGAVWWRERGTHSDTVDYLVAGRRLTLPALVMTLVSTWYGGILGVGEYTWRYGISNWLVFGVPYYAGALLFAWLFARRAREAALYTIPDLLARRYGRGPALVGALAVFVTAAPAAYVLILGTLIAVMTGLPLVPCVIAGAVLSVFYIHRGGLSTVVRTDAFQFVLMFGGFIAMVAVLFGRYGGPGFLSQALPADHWTWHGGNQPQAVLVWYFIALGTLVEPAFWQRAFAARDPGAARRGVLISVLFWMFFDFLTTTTGLYARALLPALDDPVRAFPALAQAVLPPGLLGFFFVGLLATVMSTIDSYGFVAATTLGRDVVWRLRGEASEARVPAYTRAGLWVAAAFAVGLALSRQTVVGLWHDLGSLVTPALLLPVTAALLGRRVPGPRWAMAAMLVPAAVSAYWLIARVPAVDGGAPRYPLHLEPIYAGLAASLLTFGPGWALARRAQSAAAKAA
jgi:SSS family solute:Na+ symporter